ARLPGGRMLRIGVDKAVAGALAGARACALRYDKRGVGASGGEYLRAGMDNRRAGARAALGWLAARTGGLPPLAIGHSEGAWYAAELAADHAVAGAVLLTGGARPAEEILSWQTEMAAARLPPTARMILKITRTDIIRTQRKRVVRISASTGDVIRIQGFRINARWWRDFLAYDPRPALARITVPVLAITGGQDVQVPPQGTAPTPGDRARDECPGSQLLASHPGTLSRHRRSACLSRRVSRRWRRLLLSGSWGSGCCCRGSGSASR
ncbi:MAG TPA: alpha/beta fold hydrolase, partial [Streptosporangiaceae bacterium]|nr:alpha/beta fold hydrolase [Streptosporangiaceae bacterium]